MSVLQIYKKNLQKNEKNNVALGDMRKLDVGLTGYVDWEKWVDKTMKLEMSEMRSMTFVEDVKKRM